jgi:hypothetical protein
MIIDCDSCVMRDLACSDCVVTVLIGQSGESSPLGKPLGEDEARVIDLLASRGMVPPLRFTDSGDSQNGGRLSV